MVPAIRIVAQIECKIAVANEPVGCILLTLRMLKWKFLLKSI